MRMREYVVPVQQLVRSPAPSCGKMETGHQLIVHINAIFWTFRAVIDDLVAQKPEVQGCHGCELRHSDGPSWCPWH